MNNDSLVNLVKITNCIKSGYLDCSSITRTLHWVFGEVNCEVMVGYTFLGLDPYSAEELLYGVKEGEGKSSGVRHIEQLKRELRANNLFVCLGYHSQGRYRGNEWRHVVCHQTEIEPRLRATNDNKDYAKHNYAKVAMPLEWGCH